MVAPILYEGARSRRAWLPAGASWKNTIDGKLYEGGQWIECDAPIELIPVFLRDNADLPI